MRWEQQNVEHVVLHSFKYEEGTELIAAEKKKQQQHQKTNYEKIILNTKRQKYFFDSNVRSTQYAYIKRVNMLMFMHI